MVLCGASERRNLDLTIAVGYGSIVVAVMFCCFSLLLTSFLYASRGIGHFPCGAIFMLTKRHLWVIMVETVVIFIGQRAVVDRLSSFVLC